jgi:hypothetical protein
LAKFAQSRRGPKAARDFREGLRTFVGPRGETAQGGRLRAGEGVVGARPNYAHFTKGSQSRNAECRITAASVANNRRLPRRSVRLLPERYDQPPSRAPGEYAAPRKRSLSFRKGCEVFHSGRTAFGTSRKQRTRDPFVPRSLSPPRRFSERHAKLARLQMGAVAACLRVPKGPGRSRCASPASTEPRHHRLAAAAVAIPNRPPNPARPSSVATPPSSS